MKKTIAAGFVAFATIFAFSMPASADSLQILINPPHKHKNEYRHQNNQRVVIMRQRQPTCTYKTVKKVRYNKTVITKTKICR